MHKYEIIIYWSKEDGAFVAEVPELPGCAAHGDTQEAALERHQTRPWTCGSKRPASSVIRSPSQKANV